ncbi:MAG: alanine--glyoxylate aminotransferase family protein [Bacilli bacterium]|nr:alanine--glyoxylate aminotransferase family protein [Bacilli bacterium]
MRQDVSLLRIPGPTPIPPSVERAMTQPMIGHRGEETKQLIQRIKPRLKKVFGTEEDIIFIAGSGTGGLETAVVNVANSNDEVLVLVTGSFGDRFAKICEAHDVNVHRLDFEWGEPVDVERVREFLINNKQIKAVFMTYCETSTGILNPIEEICRVVREESDALTVVDGVSCVGGVKTEMDKWGVDVLVTGSQKAMMLPPGLTFIGVSKRAWETIDQNESRRFYFDLRKYRDNLAKDSTPFTPALSLLFGLEQALTLMEEEGLENVYARHTLMMEMTRAAIKALNIPLLTTDEFAAPTVTAVKPDNFKADELRKVLKEKFNLSLAGGQQKLKGEIFRIGHMGYCTPADVLQIISLLEIGLHELGVAVELGKGVQAAQKVYLQQD